RSLLALPFALRARLMGDTTAVMGDERHTVLDQVREFSSAPRLIRTADLLIRSCRRTSPSVLIRRHPCAFLAFSRVDGTSLRPMASDAVVTEWLPAALRRALDAASCATAALAALNYLEGLPP